MSGRNKTDRLVTKQALRVVDLESLQVDPAYQREVKAKHKKIVADFNEEALGIPLVGEREDGSLWIVDGLQRTTALRKLGKTKLRAEVFASNGTEHEAEIFKLVNLNRTKLTAGEQFRALLASHDPTAWAIKEAVESAGCHVVYAKSGNAKRNPDASAKEVACINTLIEIATSPMLGVDCIRFAVETAGKCWPGDPVGLYAYVLHGLAIFHGRNEKVTDLDRLIPRLTRITPLKLIYTAGQIVVGHGGKAFTIADLIEKAYKSRLSHRRGS